MVSVNVNTPYPEFVPEVKKGYVYGDFELIKDIFMMLELGIPGYLWVMQEQANRHCPQLCALLNRPLIRAQHTASMEEAHVTGGKFWRVMALRISSPGVCARNEAWLGLPRG